MSKINIVKGLYRQARTGYVYHILGEAMPARSYQGPASFIVYTKRGDPTQQMWLISTAEFFTPGEYTLIPKVTSTHTIPWTNP